ncbi:MAG: alpha/beta fold hydrolase [Desulfosarcinaceae bacterium]|nr:alpha/beta fold hydrolase [Desulfosarcinaceae bacterium]
MPAIQREGVTIHYTDQGAGPIVVVLMHSFLCDGAMWTPQLPVLAERVRVINVDFRGHGQSGHVQTPFSVYDLLDDVVAVLDALEIDQAIWAGLSIGGMVALRAALTYPQRVSGLVVLDSHAGTEPLPVKIKYRALGLGARLFGLQPFVPAILPLMFGQTTRSRNTSLVLAWKARFTQLDVPSIWCGLQALLSRNLIVGRLPEIKVPALVMVGAEDTALPVACSREIATGLQDAEFVVIPEAGHLATLEQPEAVSRAMLSFLSRHWR